MRMVTNRDERDRMPALLFPFLFSFFFLLLFSLLLFLKVMCCLLMSGGMRLPRWDGVGTLTSANGITYVGEWKDSKKHGQGMSRARGDEL